MMYSGMIGRCIQKPRKRARSQIIIDFKTSKDMEWWLWLIIIGSILIVGVILYMLLAGGDEEEAVEEEKVAEMEDVLDLTDKKTLQALAKDGFQLTVGETQYWSASEPETREGYAWIFNEDCKDLMKIEILEGPPMKEAAAEGDEKDAKKEEGDKKEDEKKLRDGHEPSKEDKAKAEEKIKAGDTVYLGVTGTKAGECTFAAVYTESWDWKLDAEEQDKDAKLVKFELNVSEAAKEGDDKKAEEKKE